MKNGSKNKFLLCFCPVVNVDAMLEPRVAVDRPPSRRFACIPVADEHEMKNSETKSMSLDQGCPKFTVNSLSQNGRARNKNRYIQDCFGSKRSYSTYAESSSTGDEKSMLSLASVDTNIQETKSPESSLSSSSSIPPVSESKNLSKYYSTKKSSDRDQLEKRKRLECCGIYLVLVSLALTVLLGKFYGTISTTIWLYLFSLWNASDLRPNGVAKLWNTEPKACKNVDHNGRSGRKELP